MTGPTAAMLPDGKRLHLQHGPIDLIIEANGEADEIRKAYAQAIERFETVLVELVDELPILRSPLRPNGLKLVGPTARRMERSTLPHCQSVFVTPMAAVAGSVADEVLSAMVDGRSLRRAYVNNGGDIALHLREGEAFEIGIVTHPAHPAPAGKAVIRSGDPVRGIATSGRHGRSLSLGIADAVTVLARNSAMADVAATLIANAVDLPGHLAIDRQPARDLDPDSDLGERPVPVRVGPLSRNDKANALASGKRIADRMRADGLIEAAILCLDGELIQSGTIRTGTIQTTAKPRELLRA